MKKLIVLAFVLMNLMIFSHAEVFPESALPPEVVNIELTSFDAKANKANFEVKLYNPNAFKLPVREVYGDIQLNELANANIEANGKKSLGPHDTQVFSVPIIVKPDALLKASNDVMINGSAHYKFKGYMMTPVGELPIEDEGELTQAQILSFFQAVLSLSQ